jgi:hypothetical protein
LIVRLDVPNFWDIFDIFDMPNLYSLFREMSNETFLSMPMLLLLFRLGGVNVIFVISMQKQTFLSRGFAIPFVERISVSAQQLLEEEEAVVSYLSSGRKTLPSHFVGDVVFDFLGFLYRPPDQYVTVGYTVYFKWRRND